MDIDCTDIDVKLSGIFRFRFCEMQYLYLYCKLLHTKHLIAHRVFFLQLMLHLGETINFIKRDLIFHFSLTPQRAQLPRQIV